MAYVFTHSEFSPHIVSKMPYFMKKKTIECFEIDIDMPVDARFPCLFRFLSNNRQNAVLRAIMGHNDPRLRFKTALNDEALKEYTVPYDAMEVEIDNEQLTIAYSIKDPTALIRRGIMGPHGVRVYESDMPHFGPIFVYRTEKKEYVNELDELIVEHTWCKMVTPPERICDWLRQGLLASGGSEASPVAPAH